jgi:DNA-binding NarL/FixJ family response regulator
MATSEYVAIMMQARAAIETSHRLVDQMRGLREELTQNLLEVTRNTTVLKLNVTSVMATAAQPDAASAPLMTLRVEPPPPPDRPASAPCALSVDDQNVVGLLTPRELEVLRLIGEGLRTKEIAFALGISFKTAVTHRSNIMEKVGIHEGPRLVRFAIRTGIATA